MPLTKIHHPAVPIRSLEQMARIIEGQVGSHQTASITITSGPDAIRVTWLSRALNRQVHVRKYVYEFGHGGVNACREIPRQGEGLQEVELRTDRPEQDFERGYDPTPEELAAAFQEEEETEVVPQ